MDLKKEIKVGDFVYCKVENIVYEVKYMIGNKIIVAGKGYDFPVNPDKFILLNSTLMEALK